MSAFTEDSVIETVLGQHTTFTVDWDNYDFHITFHEDPALYALGPYVPRVLRALAVAREFGLEPVDDDCWTTDGSTYHRLHLMPIGEVN